MRALVAIVLTLLTGCTSNPQPSVGANQSPSSLVTTTPPVSATPGAAQSISPSDAGWPEVPLDASKLSDLTPRWLRLETYWSLEEPSEINVRLLTSANAPSLQATAARGSASYGFASDPNMTLSLNLTGGLSAIAKADPTLVATKKLSFAGANVRVQYLAQNISLLLTGKANDTPFEIKLSWPPRHADQTTGQLYAWSENGTITFGMSTHPAGNLHPLEDAAVLVWATEQTVLAQGKFGQVQSNARTLDVLVLTGMDGWVEHVAVEQRGSP